ncbi:His-Xaa-Ser system protein HxsD [Pandoraea commovens]|uniref:His-Xaa-Ser system protein HxsD n=1 Tax=Pandoraea commovens TaxID=2508289 RepID=A0A5E4UPK2_9BURK|nr:His-Xaa-Ser system protein HxsD [Pandoraea commovens]VVE00815.1 His-Xaa-Ser system protein HxsD [Pandoraea commovens]
MTIRLELDAEFYSPEAVQKSAYRFIDRLTVVISRVGGDVICEIDVNNGIETSVDNLLANFKRELLDQQLRAQIKAETEPVRNLILAYAFSRTGLQK